MGSGPSAYSQTVAAGVGMRGSKPVFGSCVGYFDTFPLTFQHNSLLKFSNSGQHGKHQLSSRGFCIQINVQNLQVCALLFYFLGIA